MSTRREWNKRSGAWLMAAVLCLGTAGSATAQTHKKAKKPTPPPQPTLPSGPTGPVQQMPLDSIAAVPPQVTFQDNQLTIVAPNSTLADILRAVRKQTGADIDVPAAPERVVTHLGPGPARDIVAELLNGSRFNYILLGSPADQTTLTRIVLVAKNGPQEITQPSTPVDQAGMGAQPNPMPQQAEAQSDAAEAEPADDNQQDDNDQTGEAEQQQQQPEGPGVKTPQQMLQEMQQRQLQMQQQQQQGQQPPAPGSGMPPHPPQEN
jgi:hypothetical protein